MAAAGMAWVRVRPDAEGFPMVPGKYGRVEWNGREWATGEARLYALSDRPRIVARLLAMPGVHRLQMGDREARLWFPAYDPECLGEVLRVIRPRRIRQMSAAHREGLQARLAAVRAARTEKGA